SIPTSNAGGIYQQWTIVNDGSGHPTLPGGSPSATGNASLSLTGLPVMSDADLTAGNNVAWYQLTIGTGSAQKIFNIYAEVDASTHQYKWTPNAQAMSATAAMDGLGFITGQTSSGPTNSLVLNVAGASGIALDSSLWTQITDSSLMSS